MSDPEEVGIVTLNEFEVAFVSEPSLAKYVNVSVPVWPTDRPFKVVDVLGS